MNKLIKTKGLNATAIQEREYNSPPKQLHLHKHLHVTVNKWISKPSRTIKRNKVMSIKCLVCGRLKQVRSKVKFCSEQCWAEHSRIKHLEFKNRVAEINKATQKKWWQL